MFRTAATRFARSVPRHRKPEFATSENSGLDCEKFHERPGRAGWPRSTAEKCGREKCAKEWPRNVMEQRDRQGLWNGFGTALTRAFELALIPIVFGLLG